MITETLVTRNLELVRSGYEAFARGDMEALRTLFRPDIVWHAQRLGQLGGDHPGFPAVLEFFGRTMELTQGTFRVVVQEALANDTSVAAVVRSTAARGDASLDDIQVHLFRMDGERVSEVWQYVGDGQAVARFWA